MRCGSVGVFRFGEQARAFGVGRQHPIDQAVVPARRLLRDVADAGIARDRDGAVVGRDFALQQAQQRRLAGAVAPDEADLVAGRDCGRCPLEDRFALDPVGEIIDSAASGEAIAGPLAAVTVSERHAEACEDARHQGIGRKRQC